MDRRNVIKLAGAAAVSAGSGLLRDTPWQRLADTLQHQRSADAATVNLMEDRTADYFRTEETTPARQLLPSLAGHLRTLQALTVTTHNDELRRRLLITAGEAEALVGWLLFDLQRHSDAVARWRSALDLARQTGDGPLAAVVLGYWSYHAAVAAITRKLCVY